MREHRSHVRTPVHEEHEEHAMWRWRVMRARLLRRRTRLEVQPALEKVAATAADFVPLRDRVAAENAAAEKVAAAQRKAEEKAARLQAAKDKKAEAQREKKWRSWAYTRLRCNDGTRSKTCVCGGNWQGCCSWHGGVDGCPPEP